ncbi:Bifunctional putA protein: proline dehydrogenase (N-terminal); delta-1-pyrroline-5-carboxylate dehydrogenase (C-terminal) [Bradyrhizobium sp. STM 3843]|uniref:bifunctional proline dehydrogenase/L-glutamate gamma-semialdehyde dehydrogenase PutA n=1 Tax=Bradyrhizobium sp. STM 3843 TaxID=551947 RepID=UPI0002407C17|nr:bifunctional proline dehydrogenase/L-glutamate gamma-semialdehyde dehydrogenase PutA [Bradyrhizobium sp. STM 3843]CCE07476.1 Bifunctional putA protein: proline dehydrogenase (N-terminal); delta-1-pyrroline-5-carboxylate dehydrogenase (C-terminal) [Bradyrhizobium sp. STM 3843]
MDIAPVAGPVFSPPYAEDDVAIADRLLRAQDSSDLPRVKATARRLIEGIRAKASRFGGIDDFLQEYALSTDEGLALMVLAEALLRVPGDATADRLIEDKLGHSDFLHHEVKSHTPLVAASAWALGLAARVIAPGETPESVVANLARRLGLPTVRTAARQAMRLLGSHFVLGETIEQALDRANSGSGRLFRYSFDMLGEGARTAADAERYRRSYAAAITAIGQAAGHAALPDRPGISVKLSALHPRYEEMSRERVLRELVPVVIELARHAKSFDLNFTVDAEEADRLDLSMAVIARVIADPSLAGWEGFGLAIQAYQKRAEKVISFIADLAEAHGRRLMVRLVKGAYWDTEIKRAQERGLDDYPVFTRKAMTDLNYLACARQMLAMRARIFPQFATHNAMTVAHIVHAAGGSAGYEFQRLHGMGEALYATLRELYPAIACRTYAPVGKDRDLLAYLVRRLLENGANSSFVSVAADPDIPIDQLVMSEAEIIGKPEAARHPTIARPRDLYGPPRRNSQGVELGHYASLMALRAEIARAGMPASAAPIIGGRSESGATRTVVSPFDPAVIAGTVADADLAIADRSVVAAASGFPAWAATSADQRARALRRTADLIEARRARLIHLLAVEAGKTLDDAIAEVREAIDFCRYYAAEGETLFGAELDLPGPTGEGNALRLRPRGVFVAISPWNFPLAIFIGQIAAALMAGNTVVAKPAEQTPLIAAETVRIMHEAGVAPGALQLVPSDGAIGAHLVAHSAISGVVFTGSYDTARAINIALANRPGPILPLIAETGGINAMLVDSTALPEQVADDVLTSAFRSAGQRCSALRLLCVQDDVADAVIEMVAGAARELAIGDPRDVATHIGPVIDTEAKARLDEHIARMKTTARVHYAGVAPSRGSFVAPHVFELQRVEDLDKEVFGPVLHVVRYRADQLDDVLGAIKRSGYGLTFGLHSRIGDMVGKVSQLPIGNIYVNRNMIGAVVGVQPFGGCGLSGTGPKAGGPHYLARFATEQTLTINTAAAGGNAALASLGDR